MRHSTLLVGLVLEREQLYERIDARVDAMVAAGAQDEVRRANAAGASATARKALGFEELLAGDIESMKRRTRNYARRQLTWMRKLAERPHDRHHRPCRPTPSRRGRRSPASSWLSHRRRETSHDATPAQSPCRDASPRRNASDGELLAAVLAGDGQRSRVFYRRHLPTVVAFLLRETGDREATADLTAEVFAAVFLVARRFRPRGGRLGTAVGARDRAQQAAREPTPRPGRGPGAAAPGLRARGARRRRPRPRRPARGRPRAAGRSSSSSSSPSASATRSAPGCSRSASTARSPGS